MNNPKLIFTAIGLLVGVIGVAFGALEAFIVLLFTSLGWVVGKYVAGEIPAIDAFMERFFSDRLRGPRR
jgi:uncharacterized membrane protein